MLNILRMSLIIRRGRTVPSPDNGSRRAAPVGVAVVAALVLSACGTSAASDAGVDASTRVVASTDVYGSIAR